jgi:polyisoprenoid-binding protein YceI
MGLLNGIEFVPPKKLAFRALYEAFNKIHPAMFGQVVVMRMFREKGILTPESNLHWNVDSTLHMVHGTFLLKSGTVHFNPQTGNAGGEIIVSATSGESGNGSRDKRMHKEILETEKYPEVIFHPKHLDGKVNRSGPSNVKLAGTLSVHGSDHELTATVHADLAGDRWTGTGKFEVPYVNWGIKDPSNFLLKVKPVVNIELEMSGSTTSN